MDPFIEWVESLGKWDGTERLKHVLSLLLGSEGELAQWAGKFLFLGPVQRAYEPGCKMDEMPVLIGPQGIGKSAVVRQCLPPEQQDEGFSDGLNLAAHPKERAEALQGKVYVEASEMAGATRSRARILESLCVAPERRFGQVGVPPESRKHAATVRDYWNGPPPVVCVCATADEETAAVAAWVKERLANSLQVHEIGMFVRSSEQLDRAQAAAKTAGVPSAVLDEHVEIRPGRVSLSTMHLTKGLEFKAVAVIACDDEVVPPASTYRGRG